MSNNSIDSQENMGLSPWRSATCSDEFWDGNPQFQDPLMSSETLHVPIQDQPSVPTSSSQLRLSKARVTHTFARPVDSISMAPSSSNPESLPSGVRSDAFARSRWPVNFGYPPMPFPGAGMPGFDPFAAQSVWSGQGFHSKPNVLDSSPSEEIRALTVSVSKLNATVNAKFKEFGGRLSLLESRKYPSQSQLTTVASVSHPPTEDDDLISLAPRSQEAVFLSHESHDSPPSSPVQPSVLGVESEGISESDPSQGVVSESLRSRVYSIRRELSNIPMASPPRSSETPSDFMSCSGMVKNDPKGYNSFPETSHFKSALSFIESTLKEKKPAKPGTNRFSGIGPTSFSRTVRSKEFQIHESSLGRMAPVCDKSFSAALGSKPTEGLQLSQSIWTKSENNLRILSNVLQTAEHFLAAAGSLLKDKGEEFDELKSFLLQVDKSLGISHHLILGTLANFTLSKRQEVLDKSNISEVLKESLLLSSLHKDKLFGFSLEKLQEELNKAPPTVKVNVQLSDGKRQVTTQSSQSVSQPGSTFSHPSRKRNSEPKSSLPSTSFGKKPKIVKGKKQGK